MSWLTWILFESVAALAGVLGFLLFALLVLWRRSGNPWPLLAGLAATVALFLVQALLVTQREHADRILKAIERDVLAGRTDALADALAPDFAADGFDRDRFLSDTQRQFDRIKVHWLERWELRILESTRDRFAVSASYISEISLAALDCTPRSGWRVTFQRAPTGWRIAEIRCLHIDGVSGQAWRRLDHEP